MITFYLNAKNRPGLIDLIGRLDPTKLWRFRVDEYNHRSLEQNALSHAWYEQLAKELPEDNELGWKCFCKLHFGVPILRAADEDFRVFYDGSLKATLTYEQKLEAMKYLPVTSLMKTKQLSAYLETMQAHFLAHGVRLEFPVDVEQWQERRQHENHLSQSQTA